MTVGELAKYIPVTLLSWAFVILVAVFTVFSGIAIYAWATKDTIVLAGYEFGSPRIGSGAVVAYDLPQCPNGWVPFEAATARFIVGAGSDFDEALSTDENGNSLSVKRYNEAGGTQSHSLTLAELPSHNHSISTGYRLDGEWHDGLEGFPRKRNGGVSDPATGIDPDFMDANENIVRDGGHGAQEQVISFEGGGQPHNNMPPYIALYFCKKR